jgi:hypothetical protein
LISYSTLSQVAVLLMTPMLLFLMASDSGILFCVFVEHCDGKNKTRKTVIVTAIIPKI